MSMQERVTAAFGADGSNRAVSGQHASRIGKRKQAFLNGIDDLLVVSTGQIGATDTAGEQRVPGYE